MTSEPRLLEVGTIDRAHGVRGEVIVHLTTNRAERLTPGAVLLTERGTLRVAAARTHKHRWIVRFEGVDDRDTAEELAGLVLRAEPLEDPDALWVHELVGCRVRDRTGTERGRVVAVEINPASDLLVLDTGALVPLRFLVEGPEAGCVVVDPPTGLFELYT